MGVSWENIPRFTIDDENVDSTTRGKREQCRRRIAAFTCGAARRSESKWRHEWRTWAVERKEKLTYRW